MTHTPGELKVAEPFGDSVLIRPIDGTTGYALACTYRQTGRDGKGNYDAKANAARFVRTWNSHDALVAACEELRSYLKTRATNGFDMYFGAILPTGLWNQFDAALKLATQETP